jgi:hypothetical protein
LRGQRTVITTEETEGEVVMTTESSGQFGSPGRPELTAGTGGIAAPTEVLPATATAEEERIIYVKEPVHWFRRLMVFVGSIALLVALFFGLVLFKVIPEFHNPFATQTTDRTGPVLLESIKDMSKYVAADGNFQVLVDLQQDNKYIPDFIFNQRTLFVGVGSVDAYVDFSKIGDGDIIVDQATKSVTINLPTPQLDKPSLDTQHSYVFDQQKGVVNHIGDLFGNNPNDLNQLYNLASDKIAQAAQDSELIDRAETNTRLMLESLLKQLGFERVTINFPPKG